MVHRGSDATVLAVHHTSQSYDITRSEFDGSVVVVEFESKNLFSAKLVMQCHGDDSNAM